MRNSQHMIRWGSSTCRSHQPKKTTPMHLQQNLRQSKRNLWRPSTSPSSAASPSISSMKMKRYRIRCLFICLSIVPRPKSWQIISWSAKTRNNRTMLHSSSSTFLKEMKTSKCLCLLTSRGTMDWVSTLTGLCHCGPTRPSRESSALCKPSEPFPSRWHPST